MGLHLWISHTRWDRVIRGPTSIPSGRSLKVICIEPEASDEMCIEARSAEGTRSSVDFETSRKFDRASTNFPVWEDPSDDAVKVRGRIFLTLVLNSL